VMIAGADPLNLVGILIPGERVPAAPGRTFVWTSETLAHAN
jgi:ATP-dependent helicase Lhr and Lhr-like helicase